MHFVAYDLVDHAVGFEKDLAVIANSQGQQFFRYVLMLRRFGQAAEKLLNSCKDMF